MTDSVVNLSEVFLTRIPVAVTRGSAVAAASTPASPASKIRRPREFVLLAVQFKSCTRLSVRVRARYYWHDHRPQADTLPGFVTRGARATRE